VSSSQTYDRDGNEVEFVTTPGPHKIVRRFDKHDWEVDEEDFVSGRLDHHTSYTYEVDERGNWVKQFATMRTLADVDTGSWITYREITYHEN